ncbi:MAG: hypothetical protein KGI54_08865 [Pseudomonadota bacterium]|nr:hypothetical protein [Pseudomonadota bacterium]
MNRPKHTYIRSKKLMALYRELPCQNCGREDGTVVGAHSNQAQHGKGRGIKADDNRCASLCARCHSTIDQGYSLNRTEREKIWGESHVKTINELVRRNRWPDDIPLPEISKPR